MSRTATASYLLRIRRPGGAEERYPLAQDAVTLGRANINTIVLDDSLTSRFHARIVWEKGQYLLTDRGSKNGTQVDGQDIQSHTLEPGEEVHLGDTVLTLEKKDGNRASRADADGEEPVGLMLEEVDGNSALEEMAEVLGRAHDELDVLDQVALLLRSVVACDRASIILVEEGTENPLMRFCHAGGPSSFGDGPDEAIIRAGLDADTSITLSVPRSTTVLDATLSVSRHVLLVPLRSPDRVLGLIVLEREPFRPHFSAEELRLGSQAGTHVTAFVRRAL